MGCTSVRETRSMDQHKRSSTVETRYKYTLRTMICMLIERNAYRKGSRESQIQYKFLIQLPIQLTIQLRRYLCIAKEQRNRGLFYCLLLNSIYLPLKLIKTQHYTSFYYLSPIYSIRLLQILQLQSLQSLKSL